VFGGALVYITFTNVNRFGVFVYICALAYAAVVIRVFAGVVGGASVITRRAFRWVRCTLACAVAFDARDFFDYAIR